MSEVRYEHIEGMRWRAVIGDGECEVTFSRERGYPGLFRGEVHGAFYHWAAAMLADVLGGQLWILDAGCGSGYGVKILWGYGHTAHGVDVDEEAVDYALLRYSGYGSFAVGDLATMPVASDSMDAVVSSDSFEHTHHGEKAADEFARVLRPGGALLLATPDAALSDGENPHHPREYTESQLCEVLTGAGLNVIGVHRFPASPGHIGVVAVKP